MVMFHKLMVPLTPSVHSKSFNGDEDGFHDVDSKENNHGVNLVENNGDSASLPVSMHEEPEPGYDEVNFPPPAPPCGPAPPGLPPATS